MTFLRNVRFGLRLLWRHPGLTAVAVLTLALGIGANTAIFSVVHATLLAPLPYSEPDRLVMVWSRIQDGRNGVSTGDYLDWKRMSDAFEDLQCWTFRGMSLSEGERPEQIQARVATPGFLTLHGFTWSHGRDFLEEEGVPGNDRVAVLTNRAWESRFGGDGDIVGRDIRLDGMPYTVVGVLAPGPADRMADDLYIPLAFEADQRSHDFRWLLVMGRLKPDVTLEQANADMERVTQRIAELHPATNQGWGASVEPLKNNFLNPDTIQGLWLLLGAVGFVLLIACGNVATLLLARATARRREVAIRAAMGAGRRQVFGQFLTESVVLAGVGGLLGVVLAFGLLRVILAFLPPFSLPSEADVQLNVPVLLFTLAVSVVSGLLFGCAPAWQATRADITDTMKDTGRSPGGGRQHLRRGLVVAEFALALTLLAGGGLAVHSLIKLMNVDLGFRSDNLLTFSLPVPPGRLDNAERIDAFYSQLVERIHTVPGVRSAAVSTGMPMRGTNFGLSFTIAGAPEVDPGSRPGAGFNMVTPEYFQTLGIQMARGRPFTPRDRAGSVRVAIVNETFVDRFLADVDPLEQRLVIEQLIPGVQELGPAVEWQIVGVYQDIRNGGLRDGFPEIDVPFSQSPWPTARVVVRTSGSPGSVRQGITTHVNALDPDLPLTDVRTMDQLVDEALAGDRFNALLFGGFAGLALLLAGAGIYAVMSFAVAQRTHEIGLRMALGAGRAQVLVQILREGMVTALSGVAVGTVGAFFVGQAMQGMWYGIDSLDPVGFGIVAVALLACGLLASYVPARRAASLDPIVALRDS